MRAGILPLIRHLIDQYAVLRQRQTDSAQSSQTELCTCHDTKTELLIVSVSHCDLAVSTVSSLTDKDGDLIRSMYYDQSKTVLLIVLLQVTVPQTMNTDLANRKKRKQNLSVWFGFGILPAIRHLIHKA